jgi:ribosome-associated protein
MVLDYGDILVHIMHESKRAYYELEELWGDVPRIK